MMNYGGLFFYGFYSADRTCLDKLLFDPGHHGKDNLGVFINSNHVE